MEGNTLIKTCTKCKKEKNLEEFYRYNREKDGRHSHCKVCQKENQKRWELKHPEKVKAMRRESTLKWKYGITHSDYLEILKEQNYGCAICGCKEPSEGSTSNSHFSVDHCHDTGRVRGILCDKCNRGLGFLGDTKEAIHKAYEYIRRHTDGLQKGGG